MEAEKGAEASAFTEAKGKGKGTHGTSAFRSKVENPLLQCFTRTQNMQIVCKNLYIQRRSQEYSCPRLLAVPMDDHGVSIPSSKVLM